MMLVYFFPEVVCIDARADARAYTHMKILPEVHTQKLYFCSVFLEVSMAYIPGKNTL